MKRNIIVGLDLGTTKISAAAGEVTPDGSLTVLAVSRVNSAGLRRGNIVDMDSTSRAIDEVLEEVERISGIHFTSVRTGLSVTSITSLVNRATIAVGHPNHEIIEEDVERAIQAARMVAIPPDRSVIHAIPRQFLVDGYEGIIDPVGMMGNRLEVEVIIVTSVTSGLQNLVRTVSRTGTKVKEIVISSVLSAESVLQPAERQMGVILVDIGGGTCDIGVFEENALIYASVLPIGGDYITRDLAVGLRTTMEEAERVKEQSGYASVSQAGDANMVEITSIYGKDTRQVSEKVIVSIIQPRVEELLDLLDGELHRSGFKGLPAGVVLTGGTSLLKGIVPVGEEYLNVPVRVGYPENLSIVPGDFFSPEYSCVLGTLLYGARSLEGSGGLEQDTIISGWLGKIAYWFKDLFR